VARGSLKFTTARGDERGERGPSTTGPIIHAPPRRRFRKAESASDHQGARRPPPPMPEKPPSRTRGKWREAWEKGPLSRGSVGQQFEHTRAPANRKLRNERRGPLAEKRVCGGARRRRRKQGSSGRERGKSSGAPPRRRQRQNWGRGLRGKGRDFEGGPKRRSARARGAQAARIRRWAPGQSSLGRQRSRHMAQAEKRNNTEG